MPTSKPLPSADELRALVNAHSASSGMEDGKSKEKHVNLTGMGIIVTSLFIVGETAGAGMIALPNAFLATGAVLGLILILLAGSICCYTGILLSENWAILQRLFPEYRDHCRKPYPAVASKAVGPRCANFVSTILQITQFGTSVVFVLLAAKNGENMLHANFHTHVSFCYMILIVGVLVFPFTLPKSPKDFWYAVIAAMITTVIAVSLIIAGAVEDYQTCVPHAYYPPYNLGKLFMSFGTIMFAHGGHPAFPTIQHDMKEPHKFKYSVSIAFVLVEFLYIPSAILGFYVYGSSLTDSIIPSIQNIPIQTIVNMLITMHVTLALTIIMNPINQELEDWFNLSHEFGFQRILSRGLVMASVVFVAESIPNFGVLLDLVGGSTITLMALILPVIFNFSLKTMEKRRKEKEIEDPSPISLREIWENTPKVKLFVNVLILVIAVLGGIAATLSATQAMFNSEFTAPCYSKLWADNTIEIEDNVAPTSFEHGKIACCGMFRNISQMGQEVCLDPTRKLVATGSHG